LGFTTISELLGATIEILHAEADLCSTKANRLKVYEKLVTALKNQEELVCRRHATGEVASTEVLMAQAATLKAQIDLERLRPGNSDKLRKLLTERLNCLKNLQEALRRQYQLGLTKISELLGATIEMFHAEADLCSTKANRLKVYEKLVTALKDQEELMQRRVDVGLETFRELSMARDATLKTQIDLERLRLGQEISQ
jgi:outer membrane protein TolC